MRVVARRVRWALIAVCGIVASSCADSPTEARARDSNIATFEQFWTSFDRTYPYFTYKGVDWRAVHDRYLIAAAGARSDAELVAVLQGAASQLRDAQISFHHVFGRHLASYVPAHSINWDRQLWTTYLSRLDWQQKNGWGYGRSGDVGYIAFESWNDSHVRITDVDAALEQLRDTRALIIDLRMNRGGSGALARSIAGRFTPRSTALGSAQLRSGPRHDDFGDPIFRTAEPRGTWQYAKPVVILVGRGSLGVTEEIAAAMAHWPGVTLAGDTTGGAPSSPMVVGIERGGHATGWTYTLPRALKKLNDGTIIEGRGVPPKHVVSFDAAAVANGRDPVLDWALARLVQ